MLRRNAAITALVVSALALLTACNAFTNVDCPAIAYSSNATITLANPQPGLTLEICDGEGCTPGPPMEPVQIGATAQPHETNLQALDGTSDVGWHATFIFGGQSTMGYRLTDEAGVVVDEDYVSVDWNRIDGSEQCGGTRKATVELPV